MKAKKSNGGFIPLSLGKILEIHPPEGVNISGPSTSWSVPAEYHDTIVNYIEGLVGKNKPVLFTAPKGVKISNEAGAYVEFNNDVNIYGDLEKIDDSTYKFYSFKNAPVKYAGSASGTPAFKLMGEFWITVQANNQVAFSIIYP